MPFWERIGGEAIAIEIALAILSLLAAFLAPTFGSVFFERFEKAIDRQAAGRGLLLALLLPIAFRVLTIPLYPPPQPKIHDEFSYLLMADTLHHGRLANPTHPMWVHFETMHVIFDPAYASKYPLGQGFALALPQFFGLPAYTGVWFSCGLMSAAVFWMLRAWLPPGFALIGASIVFLRIAILSSWMHGYWGGAVAAIGGALAAGAFARLSKQPEGRSASWFGAGVFLLANTRPYEGAALTAALGIALLIKRRVLPVWKPLAVWAILTIGVIAWHNYRVTGDPLKLPYQRNRELYGTPQSFYWQDAIPAPPFRHSLLKDNYDWQFAMHQRGRSASTLPAALWEKVRECWAFFVGPVTTVALFALPWILTAPHLRIPLLALAAVVAGVSVYPFFYPHYLGPIAGLLILIFTQSLIRMRDFRPGGRAIGLALSRWIIVSLIATVGVTILLDLSRHDPNRQYRTFRTQVADALEKAGGSHLIFVRYGPGHDFNNESVYNAADIDASQTVWARDMGPTGNHRLIDYYKGARKAWLYEPDSRPPRLSPYSDDMFRLTQPR